MTKALQHNRKGILQYLGFKHHEYWSWWLLVIPIWPLWIWYAIRLRRATWFTAVNPGMEDSGFLGESKIKILDSIPALYKPSTFFVPLGLDLASILLQLEKKAISFPLIVKPDIGGRGRKVEVIQNKEQLEHYHRSIGENYMIQNIIPFELEFGIFFIKLPNEKHGKVTSIAQKGFMSVVGNGQSSIRELMKSDYRYSLQIERMEKIFNLDNVPKTGERILLEPIGNHCRGTSFINANHLMNDQLDEVFTEIFDQIKGFYYGRFDLRVSSIEDLYQGKNIQIMELNGLTADAAHIFDPYSRLRDAYLTQIKHCQLSYQIAKQNLKKGIKPTPLFDLIRKSNQYFKSSY